MRSDILELMTIPYDDDDDRMIHCCDCMKRNDEGICEEWNR